MQRVDGMQEHGGRSRTAESRCKFLGDKPRFPQTRYDNLSRIMIVDRPYGGGEFSIHTPGGACNRFRFEVHGRSAGRK